ncbi:cupin domain-containing protein [Streptomyces sp. ISL-100]|uniref:cupin domain-containing protein n=1 Tax=Streptomyces sp. ISL-100 TaxID=2819173 RepID=UPI001BE7573B|nr:hypothetical protein [Streptomyces sp. ISL-100]MBT2396981.1 hypothetical protein [Streptomyces sp. ISL-100]
MEATLAQDPVQVAPNLYKVLFENDRVRLLEVRQKPGDESAMHGHPDCLIYCLSEGKVTFSSPSGESQEVELRTGDTIWQESQEHAAKNTGATDVVGLVFELK